MSDGQLRDTSMNGEVDVGSTPETDGVQAAPDAEDGDDDQRQQPDDNDDRETHCGMGSWRPRYLYPFGNLWCFTAALSIMSLLGSGNFTYYVAVITQIERRFGLSSQTTGFIKNIDNIGFMLVVMAVAHLGRYRNKPLILGTSCILSGIAIFIFGIPHFIYGGPGTSLHAFSTIWNASSTVERRQRGKFEICDGVGESPEDPSGCSSRSMLLDFNGGALALFVISELLQGMANSPKPTLSLTYLDDNARERSPIFFGVMFAMRSFSPMIGFALGAWTNSLYVDLSEPDIDQRDPRWIGAWWLGFVICGASITIWSLPVLMFPPKIAGADSSAASDDKNLLSNVRDLPRSCWRLLNNPIYVTLIISACLSFSITGYTTFLPKYLQFHFGFSASLASVYTGVMMGASWTIGPLIGGPLLGRLKLNIRQLLAVILIVHSIILFGYLTAMLLDCPEAQWAGIITQEGPVPLLECNGNCSCDPMAFTPVCGSDGRNYFSACYAGCQTESRVDNRTKFFDCRCIEDGQDTASAGLCPQQCNSFYVFLVVIFLTFLLSSTMMVPFITVLLRCVDDKDKAMGVAFGSCVANLAAFPAPMIYGAVIDSTCRVLQQSCTRKGACLLYDHDSFRFRLYLLPLCTQLATVVLKALAWYFSCRREKAAAVDAANTQAAHRDDTEADGKTVDGIGPNNEDGGLDTKKETIV